MNVDDYFAEREARDPEFRAAWDALRPTYEFQRALIEARIAAGLTQRELAVRLGTKQPAIARLESGQHPPRLDTLQQLADALGVSFVVRPHAPLALEFPPSASRQAAQAADHSRARRRIRRTRTSARAR
jgi:transcriptional regulator with XRE-family HTH domain